MRLPEEPLNDPEFHRRHDRIWKTLAGLYGEVGEAFLDDLGDGRRRVRFELSLPGYGAPVEARMILIEYWAHDRARWHLDEYRFDYHLEPMPSGRKAHHWHGIFERDRVFHAHCEDPRPRQPHYRDVPVRLEEAAREFAEMHYGAGVDCRGLFPLVL